MYRRDLAKQNDSDVIRTNRISVPDTILFFTRFPNIIRLKRSIQYNCVLQDTVCSCSELQRMHGVATGCQRGTIEIKLKYTRYNQVANEILGLI